MTNWQPLMQTDDVTSVENARKVCFASHSRKLEAHFHSIGTVKPEGDQRIAFRMGPSHPQAARAPSGIRSNLVGERSERAVAINCEAIIETERLHVTWDGIQRMPADRGAWFSPGTREDIEMLKRMFINPENMRARVQKTEECPEGELLFSPIIVISDDTHTHVYLAGQVGGLPNGEVESDDMRAQIRQTCENIGIALNHVGATFDDVVTTTTYVTDLQKYYEASDERFKYFKNNRPASTLVQISSLSLPQCKIEITCKAIIETDRLRVT